ncbi:hypothetical protein DYB25_012757 [Aphanomyces astaci]|uniref:FYVE-type domain-containing protein n=2 Tax=Aphanomyces astaci TaxID=112090 RepID=A0A397BI65_APHAT|nr:hypothetical protein DYB25_012757 [Aphanomyces astaci]
MLPTADVFECHLPLSASVRDDLLEIAGGAWKGLVENAIASEVYPIDKIVRNRTTGRCATLRRPRDIVDATQGMVAHSRTRATIEQAADFFYLDTPAKAQQFARVMDELVEAKRALYPLVDRPVVVTDGHKNCDNVVVPATASALDYMSVDWMMIKFKKGVPARDLCYLEILNLDEHFTTERLKPLLSAPLDMSLAHAATCGTCRLAFSWRHPKKLCRACGDPICPKCSSQWSLTLHGSAIKVPLCKRCVGPGLNVDDADEMYLIESKDRKQRYSTASDVVSTIRDTYLSIDRSESSSSSFANDIMHGIDQQKELLHKLQDRLAAIRPAY